GWHAVHRDRRDAAGLRGIRRTRIVVGAAADEAGPGRCAAEHPLAVRVRAAEAGNEAGADADGARCSSGTMAAAGCQRGSGARRGAGLDVGFFARQCEAAAAHPNRLRGTGTADRVLERGEPAAGARYRAETRDLSASGTGRAAWAACAAVADRKR